LSPDTGWIYSSDSSGTCMPQPQAVHELPLLLLHYLTFALLLMLESAV